MIKRVSSQGTKKVYMKPTIVVFKIIWTLFVWVNMRDLYTTGKIYGHVRRKLKSDILYWISILKYTITKNYLYIRSPIRNPDWSCSIAIFIEMSWRIFWPSLYGLKDISTLNFSTMNFWVTGHFNPWLFNPILFNPMVQ